jgi:hypothetical protein
LRLNPWAKTGLNDNMGMAVPVVMAMAMSAAVLDCQRIELFMIEVPIIYDM